MTIHTKAAKKSTPGKLTLGRAVAAKLNAVEGLSLPEEMCRVFAEFDSLDLPAGERRRRLMKQFGGRSS